MSRALVERRFPALAAALKAAGEFERVAWSVGPVPVLTLDGVQLESRFDARAEAELQARLVPLQARTVTVYGTAQGTLVRLLLARKSIERLRVVVLNPRVFAAVLAHVRCEDWLADPRLELVLAAPEAELAAPFVALPAELCLAEGSGARLADLARLELATPFVRRKLREQEPLLLARIATNLVRFGTDASVDAEFGSRPGASLCLAAAGPTLAEHYEELRARAQELVAVDAALKPLLAAGIVPAFVVTQDPHEEGMRRVFAVAHAGLAHSTLVYFPEVFTGVMERWPGPRRRAWSESALHARCAERRPSATLFASGSVIHPAADLCVRLGARRVELFGADFALCGGQSHVRGAAWERAITAAEAGAWVLDVRGARVPSLPNLVGYLRDFERYLAGHPEVEWRQRSRAGAAIAGACSTEAAHAA
ncbi:MAG: 6-hydroxymethylpterin diphosphokinase MptE-like protein [Planctomycetota bacterium]